MLFISPSTIEGYFTLFSVSDYTHGKAGWRMNNESERIWKEAIVAQPRYHPEICFEGLRKATKASVRMELWQMYVCMRQHSNKNAFCVACMLFPHSAYKSVAGNRTVKGISNIWLCRTLRHALKYSYRPFVSPSNSHTVATKITVIFISEEM
jgi:hypothetical protein